MSKKRVKFIIWIAVIIAIVINIVIWYRIYKGPDVDISQFDIIYENQEQEKIKEIIGGNDGTTE